jgi:DNA gyrase subunit B
MPELVDRGYIYIAQPPLYKAKRGKQEQYIKDDNEMERYLLQLALDEARLHLNAASPAISGEALETLVRQFNATKHVIARLARRYDRTLLDALLFESLPATDAPEAISAEAFAAWIAQAVNTLNAASNGARTYATNLDKIDDNAWTITVNRRQHGLDHIVTLDRDFFLMPETKLLIGTNRELDGLLGEGAFIQRGERKLAVSRFDQVVAWLMQEANRGLQISRYKGLGEMNPDQLWETTLNPETRRLMQVRVEDAIAADEVFTTLMGDQVEPRRDFIEKNALSVSNLDV